MLSHRQQKRKNKQKKKKNYSDFILHLKPKKAAFFQLTRLEVSTCLWTFYQGLLPNLLSAKILSPPGEGLKISPMHGKAKDLKLVLKVNLRYGFLSGHLHGFLGSLHYAYPVGLFLPPPPVYLFTGVEVFPVLIKIKIIFVYPFRHQDY